MDDAGLLRELEPTVGELLERHLASTREWFPHQHVPYGRGRDFDAGEAWRVDSADLGGAAIDEAVRSSLIVNLLTEDNLPYYFRTIERRLGAEGAGGLVEALDGRGGPPLDGDLRLPHGHPGGRPRRTRAVPDASGVDGPGAR